MLDWCGSNSHCVLQRLYIAPTLRKQPETYRTQSILAPRSYYVQCSESQKTLNLEYSVKKHTIEWTSIPESFLIAGCLAAYLLSLVTGLRCWGFEEWKLSLFTRILIVLTLTGADNNNLIICFTDRYLLITLLLFIKLIIS